MTTPGEWFLEGSYFEACNCEAVCPCGPQDDNPGGRSTYGICDWAPSWFVERGETDELDLSGLQIVLTGRYDDEPGSPWRVGLSLDECADSNQQRALTDIFLGRAGGTTLGEWTQSIADVYAVRPARIELDHTLEQPSIDDDEHVTVRAREAVDIDETVSCAIPGYENPGTEYRCEILKVDEPPLRWEVTGRCGFGTDFAYRTAA